LTLKNIRAALKAVTEAAGTGAAKNLTAGVDAEALLDQAVAGMDDALLKAVEANRVALGQLVSQGADLREKHLKKALEDLDKFEDTMFAAVKKAAAGVDSPMAGAWNQVLEKMQAGGTLSGAKASSAAEQLAEQMHGAMRSSRAASMRAAQALAESYTAMVSGVLLGMSDALQAGTAAKKTAAKK
jgi:CRISPR/Cas system-associated exonuclease Cas4 (RecB family)